MFPYHKIHPFKVYGAEVFKVLTMLCSYYPHVIPENFHPQYPLARISHFPLPNPNHFDFLKRTFCSSIIVIQACACIPD